MPTANIANDVSWMIRQIKCACDNLQYRCDDDQDYCISNYTCFTALVQDDDVDVYTMGCMGHREYADLTCHVGSQNLLSIKCCNTGDFCNQHLYPSYVTTTVNDETAATVHVDLTLQQGLYGLTGLVLLLIILVLAVWRAIHWHQKQKLSKIIAKNEILAAGLDGLHVTQMGDSTCKVLFERSCTSGSGSGMPLLAQRTVSSSICLVEKISKGRYGEVWRGVYHGENVAVKIFHSYAESFWYHECCIYNTVLLRHDNVLGYIAADTVSRDSCTQLWLIMHYHDRASLYDHLKRHALTAEEALRMILSAASGLVHLHSEIVGTQGKPAIAHRDVKSKNILVMANGQCCIADLGLAVVQPSRHQKDAEASAAFVGNASCKVGTKRYMAPEILNETIDINVFDSFRQADVYAFGLVMWEIARRCIVQGLVDDYQLPYYDLVPNDPSCDDMKRVVCSCRQRPPISSQWNACPVMRGICRLMSECWYEKPGARVSILRVRKTVNNLVKTLEIQKQPADNQQPYPQPLPDALTIPS